MAIIITDKESALLISIENTLGKNSLEWKAIIEIIESKNILAGKVESLTVLCGQYEDGSKKEKV